MNPNYETTPTPLADLEDRQEVITSTGAEGVIIHYGAGSSHNVRLRLLEEEDHTLPQPVIEALNLEFHKKLDPKEYLIVWSGRVTLTVPKTLAQAQSELNEGWDEGTIYRLVPVETEGQES